MNTGKKTVDTKTKKRKLICGVMLCVLLIIVFAVAMMYAFLELQVSAGVGVIFLIGAIVSGAVGIVVLLKLKELMESEVIAYKKEVLLKKLTDIGLTQKQRTQVLDMVKEYL